MKSWTQLLNRSGWVAQEQGDIVLLPRESMESMQFLLESLQAVNASFKIVNSGIQITSLPVAEETWLTAVDIKGRGRSECASASNENTLFNVRELDTYIAGVVRQLNRLSFSTTMSCDGHDKRRPVLYVPADTVMLKELKALFDHLHVSYNVARQGRTDKFSFMCERTELLQLAEQLSEIPTLAEGYSSIAHRHFADNLEKLLMIEGRSGEENAIRTVVYYMFAPLVDRIEIDAYGNLLAEKRCGDQHTTILLSAHLDTAASFVKGRQLVKNGAIWSSSEGILGADDRAGIAVLYEVAKRLSATTFKGTVKFVFSVEEEIGVVGAKHVDDNFTADVDAAVVVNRRGTGDIVTSYQGYMPFCQPWYGSLFEKLASNAGMHFWQVTPGGMSDTYEWAERGINSVNLSVGYRDEHTHAETVDIEAAYNTSKLVLQLFSNTYLLRKKMRCS